MGSSKKRQPAPPPIPDPEHIARTDARFNRIDQFTPFGSLTFSGDDRNIATMKLSPELQGLFTDQLSLDQSLLGAAKDAIPGIENLINNPLPGNFDTFREDAAQALFDRSSHFLNEQFDRDEGRLDQKLANQGIQGGSEAFGAEQGEFLQRKGETFENLARDATIFGGQEGTRDLSNTTALRGSQFNELASLLGLQQVQQPGLNSFFSPGQTNTTDAFGLQQSALNNRFNTQSGAASQAKGGVAELIGQLGGGYLAGR